MAGKNTFPFPRVPLKALKLLADGKIPFVIVGGAAIALHGIPRSTLDIDIVIPAEEAAVNRFFSVITDAGLLNRDKNIISLIRRPDLLIGQWITLQEKNGIDIIDVFFENEKEFNGLFRRARHIKGRNFNSYIASLNDLEKMKKRSARPIDLADIALIREKRGKPR